MARSLSLPSLFHTYIRYEGSPGLWHFLLWILVRLHVSYSGLHWICGAIAVFASSLLIFKSPFPRYLRLGLPFTFFLLFEYAVVARSYVLVPLLLYLIAICWKKHPLLLAALLGLLANVALHASVMSGGLAIVYCIEQFRTGAFKNPARRRQLLLFAAVLVSFYAFAIWTAWPAHDMHHIIAWMGGQSRAVFAWTFISLVWAVCEPWILSILFWIAIALCLKVRRSLFYLLPVLFFSIFSGAIALDFHNAGLVVPLVICLLWITGPPAGTKSSRSEAAGYTAVALLAVVQILWSAFAISYDHSHAYSPDAATAEFLQPLVRNGATIAVASVNKPTLSAYESVGILPYFDHPIFVNQSHPFWSWSDTNQTDELLPDTLHTHPAIVIIQCAQDACQFLGPSRSQIRLLIDNGYKLTDMFCGSRPYRFELRPRACHLIFQRSDTVQHSAATRTAANIALDRLAVHAE